ncbi:unnamed protein product [Ambrosiozyma monospora]|uniref:Unnamed protein product n=1 Tax=Ambrosiozyma monospora TaxID=43982 RepID=A0ACB5U7I5_AMBMO|nr:unnamed protein product [Ambrosiozyma monospora]
MMDLDLGASDSTNIQDFFTDFGAVLIFVQYATSHLCLDPAKVTMNKKVSNILMSSVSVDYYTYLEQSADKSSSQMNDWIYSLFDSTNTDGISDDLIKSSSIIDYHYMLPEILKEAIVAFKLGVLDEDSLIAGLDYFQQPFLISNLPQMVLFLLNYLWTSADDVGIVIKVLTKLSVCEMNGEAAIMHSLVLTNLSSQLHEKLAKFAQQNGLVSAFLQKLPKPRDIPSDSFEGFLNYIVDPAVEANFELVSV